MFKSASENYQLRTRRVAIDSRSNSGGIDPSVFKPQMDRALTKKEQLVLRKMELERKVGSLKGQMSIATSRRRLNQNGQVDDVTFNRWTTEFGNLRNEIRRIDAAILHMKVDARVKEEGRALAKSEVFVQVAREMLAEPIFKTLMREAVRRLDGSENDPQGK